MLKIIKICLRAMAMCDPAYATAVNKNERVY